LGDLARGQGTLDYHRARPLVVHLHQDSDVGRCETTRTPLLAETIPEWCANPNAVITVQPVRDLAEHIHAGSYEVPDRLAEQSALVDHHCVFPWCTRPATRCDTDHVVPHNKGGPTCSCNTAPLCRGHHRLKTHSGWTYDVLDRGTYLWHSPNGHAYRRDHTGSAPEPERRP